MRFANYLLALKGIDHPDPMKLIWLALVVASVVLKVTLCWRLWSGKSTYQFPAFSILLIASAIESIFYMTGLWGLWGEVMLAAASLLAVAEIVDISVFTVEHRPTRSYDRALSFFLALVIFGIAIYQSPPAYPGYPHSLYYIRLYSTVACFAAAFGAALFRWGHKTASPRFFISHNLIILPWFGVTVWTGLVLNQGNDRWLMRMIGVIVQMACLIAWHSITGVGGAWRGRRGSRLSARGSTFGLPHGGPSTAQGNFR
jgi:hypothetical protein